MPATVFKMLHWPLILTKISMQSGHTHDKPYNSTAIQQQNNLELPSAVFALSLESLGNYIAETHLQRVIRNAPERRVAAANNFNETHFGDRKSDDMRLTEKAVRSEDASLGQHRQSDRRAEQQLPVDTIAALPLA